MYLCKGGYRIVNKIAAFIKENRRAAGLTQEEFAARSGLGLRSVSYTHLDVYKRQIIA